jgi:hypothetical protein
MGHLLSKTCKSRWVALLLTFTLLAGCMKAVRPSTTTPTVSPTLHAQISDPAGDALPDSRVPRSPDLVRGTATVVARSVTFTARFVPGTFAPSTQATIQLDTDQNPSTGIRNVNGLGVDYAVGVCRILWGNHAQVMKSKPPGSCTRSDPCYIVVGKVPVKFVDDGFDVTIPLSLLGSADGRLDFKVLATTYLPEGIATAVLDVMPDVALPPGRLQ